MTIPTGIGLKFTLTPVNPPQRLIIIARNFSTYVIFYKIRSCREPSKQFVQVPIAYKQFFFYGKLSNTYCGYCGFQKGP